MGAQLHDQYSRVHRNPYEPTGKQHHETVEQRGMHPVEEEVYLCVNVNQEVEHCALCLKSKVDYVLIAYQQTVFFIINFLRREILPMV